MILSQLRAKCFLLSLILEAHIYFMTLFLFTFFLNSAAGLPVSRMAETLNRKSLKKGGKKDEKKKKKR